MTKYICVHCHFYQPPRENPWTNIIDEQPTASPYHNWNERINHECYVPNSHVEVVSDENGAHTVNNYEHISFNFGPTLMSWLKNNDQKTYQAILKADQRSKEHFDGHGSAIAQAYHHIILPLANSRDKRTQIYWGIEDFKYHYNRVPEGMWMPETAVDLESLDILSEYGVLYTILAPNQAKQIRQINTDDWKDVKNNNFDISVPYFCALPSGRNINIFFYNGPLSNEVAFEKLLKNGETFAHRIMDEFNRENINGELMHIATDGETYGHHHKFGEMALAYMLDYIEKHNLAQIINYGAFLKKHPPSHEVKINENTSWSCSHGVERWRSDCGCKIAVKKDTTQEWREHLRAALDWLRDTISPHYESVVKEYFCDPWEVRDQYIHTLLKSNKEIEVPIERYVNPEISREDYESKIFPALEMQRMLMMMYTSCGWFFDDVSGIETVQIMMYAANAIKIFEQLTGSNLENEFMNHLAEAHSNSSEYKDGKEVYLKLVKSKIPQLSSHGK